MKKASSALLALFFCAAAAGTAGEARFMRYPTVSGDRIVFTYEGDLWSVGAAGGPAARLTSHPGIEAFAKFSPDGKRLAFTASYDGPQAVYVMPAEGGEPKRLTYNPSSAQVIGWTPDGAKVVYRSMFENVVGRDPNLYFIGLKGTAPERFPLDRGVLCSFSPDGKRMLYCRRGNEEYYWKRYKGGQYQDIWMYDWATRKASPVTDYVGKNSYPMWIGDAMAFVSDRGNGISNLYTQALGSNEARPLTSYADFDVMMPSTDGRSIVYVQDGNIHILDAGSGRDAKVPVTVPSDRWTLRPRTINPKDYIHAVDVANDGRAVILEARGDVFAVPTEKGPARNLSNTAGTREMYPAVSPDGRTVAFFSDRTGDYQLYTQPVGGGEWTALTTG
ncbi:MAG TPA: protease, partial [Acidobacteriota bacterium]|nr:protease [Acidobacteriota bacterium]